MLFLPSDYYNLLYGLYFLIILKFLKYLFYSFERQYIIYKYVIRKMVQEGKGKKNDEKDCNGYVGRVCYRSTGRLL